MDTFYKMITEDQYYKILNQNVSYKEVNSSAYLFNTAADLAGGDPEDWKKFVKKYRLENIKKDIFQYFQHKDDKFCLQLFDLMYDIVKSKLILKQIPIEYELVVINMIINLLQKRYQHN
tara:strand:+ start:75 stop:431 length:357 start_codon:yes stop_codon:yes gene_type:complete